MVSKVLLLLLIIGGSLILSGAVFAESLPQNTTINGTVSGDLYVNASQPVAFGSQTSGVTHEITQNNTLPTYTSIQWARVYVSVYSGSGDKNYPVRTTTKLDANGDGDYDDAGETLGVEDMNILSSKDGTVYWLNDHCNKVYSDYLAWYDVTSLITSNNPTLYVKTENLDVVPGDTYDGRVKMLALLVAYNDGDADKVDYWVNAGQDWFKTGTSQTTFNTSTVTANVGSATLNTAALSGTDGSYTFNGNVLYAGGASYPNFEAHTWDVTSNITKGADSTLVYGLVSGQSSFKNVLATLTVRELLQPDLVVTNVSVNVGAGAYMFANEPNVFTVTVNNTGNGPSAATTLAVDVNGITYNVAVPALAAGATTNVTVTDTVSHVAGANLPVNANADPSNNVPESNEGNNVFATTVTVYNNGYKGKRFTGGSDLNTQQTFVGKYDVIYSAGNSTYKSGSSWNTPYVVSWGGSDLPIPAGVTVTQVRLYQGYTWNTPGGLPDFVASFNGNILTPLAHYSDTKGFVGSNYPSGLIVYDVTSFFNTAGNTLTLTKGANTLASLYGSYIVLVYADPATTNKTIYINDEADLLCSRSDYSVNDTEATAYANFNGVSTVSLSSAKVINILASASDKNASKFYFNGDQYGDESTGLWSGYITKPQIGFSVFDVTGSVVNGANTAGLMSFFNGTGTTGDNMVIFNSILIITKDTTAPTVTANPHGGLFNTTQSVTITASDDQDSNPTIYYTTNGSDPTTGSILYTGPIGISSSTVLKFIAVDDVGNVCSVQSEIYTIDTVVPTVSANPHGGLFNAVQSVTLTAVDNYDSNPVIYYTTNGSDPTTGSILYTGPIGISSSTVLKFIAVDTAGNQGSVQSETYTIDLVAPGVNANPTTCLVNHTLDVYLTATEPATIYYTTNGNNPTTSSSVYSGPLHLGATATVKFMAVDTAGNQGSVQSETFTIDTHAPTVNANVDSGTYDAVQSVVLTATDNLDANPDIYYTTNGNDPITTSTRYTGPIAVNKAMKLKFIAVDDAGNVAPVQTKTYNIKSEVYVQVTASNNNPSVGDTVKYTFKLGNYGPGIATDVVFTYQIPEGMEYAGVTKDSGIFNYDPATRTITWTFSELDVVDPYLWLDLYVLSPGTYLIQPEVLMSNYNPGLSSHIASLRVNAAARVVNAGTSTAQAATTTQTVQAGTVPMQNTGIPLAGLILAVLCIFSGLGLYRR